MNHIGFGKNSFALKAIGFTNKTNPDDAMLALFAGGKQGVFYDPSDKSTLFQDVAGTIPVTKNGDPVALMRDKSGNGNHAKQKKSSARPLYKTDGILHWLEGDGVDDLLTAENIYWDIKSYYWAVGGAFVGASSHYGFISAHRYPYTFNSDYMQAYSTTAANEPVTRVQRTPTFERASPENSAPRPELGLPFVEWQTINNSISSVGIIPSTVPTKTVNVSSTHEAQGAITLLSGISQTPSKARIYGVIWLKGIDNDTKIKDANEYLAKKSGVTL